LRLADTNLLLYASDSESQFNATARAWLDRSLSGTETLGFADLVLLAFLRLSTNPVVAAVPLSPREAFDQIDDWLAQPSAAIIHPGSRHLAIWRGLLEAAGTAGNLTNDAHLAALAIEHNATLATFDGDFHRFTGLRLDYLH
jgi:toxin-antitoxin system PIN domain toxin